MLANPAVTSPIIGANTVAQLSETLGTLEVMLNDAEKAALDGMSAWE
jgi:aryl-alcohol dehydrogenase-like predicted oxidoreductase